MRNGWSMELYQSVYIALYSACLLLYFHNETGDKFKYRAFNKITLAAMYLAFFAYSVVNHHTLSWMTALACLGFAFSWLGDVVLLFDFVKGAFLFFAGNIFFILYEVFLMIHIKASALQICLSVMIFILLIGTFFFLYFAKVITFGKFKALLPMYLITVTMHGSTGVVIAASGNEVKYMLFGLGMVFFMLSDYFLVCYELYHKKKWVLRTNSGLYFLGMMLASLSFSI